MNITKEDVGRKVMLRDGSVDVITGFNIEYPYSVELGLVDVTEEGFFFGKDNISECDVVSFIEEEVNTPQKFDDNKPRTDLVRPEFILNIAKALEYGASKYNETRGEVPNYLKGDGFNYSKIYASLQRHLNEWYSGVDIDEESGLNHLQLAATNIMFLMTYNESGCGIDDRIILKKGGEL